MILLLGSRGFVGSAFHRLFEARGIAHESITRESYPSAVGRSGSVVINASANSRKYLAEQMERYFFGAGAEMPAGYVPPPQK